MDLKVLDGYNWVYFVWFSENLDNFDMNSISREQRDVIEADSFWCLSKFLDSIQDNYIFAQLGIQQKVNQLKDLIQRIDSKFLYSNHCQGRRKCRKDKKAVGIEISSHT